ncbi:Glutathione S-transferase U9 [Senna tora]|uniref:Glutathione S-transferase n=1 Tax=Senna tora TaxID=362788 RepID=A0A834SU47_9FABA|nr:Glutathione S-transferase U9 [Senna tora]
MSGVENGMKGFFKDGIPEVDSNCLGLLDIIIWSTFMSHKSLEQVFGIKFLDPERFPLLFSWVNALNKVALVKETTPPHEEVLFEHMFIISKSEGEVQEKALEGLYERLSVVEDGMKSFFKDGIPEVDSKSLGLLDIIIWSTFMFQNSVELVFGIKILDPERFPLLFSWVNALNEVPVVKEATPPHEKQVGLLQSVRQGGKSSTKV